MLLRLANKGSLRNEALLTKQRSELISNSLNDARSSQSLSQRTTRIRRLASA